MPSNKSRTSFTLLFVFWLLAVAGFVAGFFALYGSFSGHEAALNQQSDAAIVKREETQRTTSGFAPSDPVTVPAFDKETAEYILTAFSLQGMQHVTDAEPSWTMLPPGNILVAQLIKRDPSPEVITEGVSIRYTLDKGITGDFAEASGAHKGELTYQETPTGYVSLPIPVMPYTTEGAFMPYPMATVEAVDKDGAVLAQTRVVLPVSTEMGCRNCHTGDWKVSSSAGISKGTADHILAVHDKRNRTDFMQRTANGETISCKSCHGTRPDLLNLSAALHSFHATMGLEGAEACGSCHPSSTMGTTQFFRDFHDTWGMDCTRCHGTLPDHALSLLIKEQQNGKPQAAQRMTRITPVLVTDVTAITPRTPWVNLPQCSGCHSFSEKPDASTASAFNKWTESEDQLFSHAVENSGKIRCASCHGAPHAVYPASNPIGDERDNMQPLQYQNHAGPLGSENNCAVCHTVPMDYFLHHDRVE